MNPTIVADVSDVYQMYLKKFQCTEAIAMTQAYFTALGASNVAGLEWELKAVAEAVRNS